VVINFRPLFLVLTLGLFLALPTGCAKRSQEPTILTLWHNYGGQLKETMDELIDEFNETVGLSEGIIINVTSISGSAAIHDKLLMAAHGEPGAPHLPDITIAYPKTALLLAEKGLLADLEQFFTPEELAAYIPQFLDEGRLNGNLYVFPTAKSTEVLFLNKTIFDRFAAETGAKIEDLQTFEGISRIAALYHDWIDPQGPQPTGNGKTFFMSDSLFNFALVGTRQLGVELIDDGKVNTTSPEHAQVWQAYFKPAVLGQAAIYNGYAADLFKTGEIICATGSTAGVLFYPQTVTYPDNSSEPLELAILPYPVFEGGEKVALQRGAGMCVFRSTPERERLAAIFLKWFTAPENNLRFVSSTGYLPVTKEAFGEIMSREIKTVDHENIKALLQTCQTMQKEYTFYVTPLFEGVDQLQEKYENCFKEAAQRARESYLERLSAGTPQDIYEAVADQVWRNFVAEFQ
jgi:multiple sugar transport system substrate-binding protein